MAVGIASLALVTWIGTLVVPATGGALTGSIRNTVNTAASGIYAGTTTCVAAAQSIGSAYFIHTLAETAGSTATADSSGNSRPGTYRNTGNITYRAAGPCPRDGARAVTLRGSDSAAGYVTNNTRVSNPTVFSFSLWFRTTTTTGGKLMGFGNAASGSSTQYDRHLYMTNTGVLVAGIYDGQVETVASQASYRDDAWHHAVVTLSPAGNANPGLRLYVDGSLIASDSAAVQPENYAGYWRLGWDNLNSWTNVPTRQSFAGSLSQAAVFTTALTPAQVTTLYRAGI